VLARRKGAEVAPELQQTLLSDASDTLRLRALSGLARIGGEKLEAQLAAAAHDPSEMVRRKAVTLIGEIASESLLPVLWEVLATDPSPRVAYDAANALESFGRERAETSLKTWLATPSARRSSELEASLRTRLPATRGAEGGSLADDLAALSAADLDPAARMDAIRAFRHVHAPAAIEPLLALAKDEARDAKMRRAAIEALGWFVYSRERASIESANEQLAATASAPQAVRDEATKTVRRLRAGANHPLTP
jgi:HEAT repeat protein